MKNPFANAKIHPPFKVAALVDVLIDQGLSPDHVLNGSSITLADIGDRSTLISISQYERICLNALALGAVPETPFRVAKRLRVSAYGMYGYAAISCASIGDYFDMVMKYRALATPTIPVSWRITGSHVVWEILEPPVERPKALTQFLTEQQFMNHLVHLRDLLETEYFPTRATFAYASPVHAHLYEGYLGCKCDFGMDVSQLFFDAEILDEKPKLSHPLTAKLLEETCDKLVGAFRHTDSASGEVYRVLLQVPGRFPEMREVASRLGVTERTLRRHLSDEGRSFREIVDEIRQSVATEYLQSTSMSIDDIAGLLGFADTPSFSRAFKRWTGRSPGTLTKLTTIATRDAD